MRGQERMQFRALVRRRNVTALYLKGMTQQEIAEEEGVDQATVSRDLEVVRERLWGESEENLQELRTKELMRLKLVEEAAWESFEEERARWREEEKDDEEEAVGADETAVGKKGEKGARNHWRYLEIALKCSVQRRKLLGLDVSPEIAMARESRRRNSPDERDDRVAKVVDGGRNGGEVEAGSAGGEKSVGNPARGQVVVYKVGGEGDPLNRGGVREGTDSGQWIMESDEEDGGRVFGEGRDRTDLRDGREDRGFLRSGGGALEKGGADGGVRSVQQRRAEGGGRGR